MDFEGYTLDINAAKKATAGGSVETGKVIATIVRAEFIRSDGGAEGMEFEIKTDTDATGHFTIWTRGKNGSQIAGYAVLQSIMVIARQKTLTPEMRQVQKYNYDSQSRAAVTVPVAKELMGKKLGCLLFREAYVNNKEVKSRLAMYCCFDPESEMVASEILDRKTKSEELSGLLVRMLAKEEALAKKAAAELQNGGMPAYGSAMADDGFPQVISHQIAPTNNVVLDDDLPF